MGEKMGNGEKENNHKSQIITLSKKKKKKHSKPPTPDISPFVFFVFSVFDFERARCIQIRKGILVVASRLRRDMVERGGVTDGLI